MQFAVPQFTDVEDKLIGPLTLKQFFFLLATGGVVMFFYALLKLSIFFFLIAIPIGLTGVALTFGKFNSRPLYSYLGAFFNFVSRPQTRIFKREELDIFVSTRKAEPVAANLAPVNIEPAESRLKKLAYLLDQKTEEEKNLIEHGTDNR